MTLTRWAAVAVLALPLTALGAETPPLSPTEAALLKVACAWADGSRADVAKRKCGAPSELEWSSARRGRFVERDGEWLVSLAAPCIGGCTGVTIVARKQAGQWTKLLLEDGLVTGSCLTIHGFADGWDRIACQEAAGPHFGAMAEWVDLRGYANEGSSAQILYKDHGGECFLAEPPAKAEYDGDDLSDLTAGEAGSDVAFTIRLAVLRAECDQTVEDPQDLETVGGEYVLRFVKRGNAVVPDEPTRGLLDRYGWTPER
jgi:hypothetical protein